MYRSQYTASQPHHAISQYFYSGELLSENGVFPSFKCPTYPATYDLPWFIIMICPGCLLYKSCTNQNIQSIIFATMVGTASSLQCYVGTGSSATSQSCHSSTLDRCATAVINGKITMSCAASAACSAPGGESVACCSGDNCNAPGSGGGTSSGGTGSGTLAGTFSVLLFAFGPCRTCI